MNKVVKILLGGAIGAGTAYGYEKAKEAWFKNQVMDCVKLNNTMHSDVTLNNIKAYMDADMRHFPTWRQSYIDDVDGYAQYITEKAGYDYVNPLSEKFEAKITAEVTE